MEWSACRPYRRHLIVACRIGLFGQQRWDVWERGRLVGTFGDMVSAELHVDARLARRGDAAS